MLLAEQHDKAHDDDLDYLNEVSVDYCYYSMMKNDSLYVGL